MIRFILFALLSSYISSVDSTDCIFVAENCLITHLAKTTSFRCDSYQNSSSKFPDFDCLQNQTLNGRVLEIILINKNYEFIPDYAFRNIVFSNLSLASNHIKNLSDNGFMGVLNIEELDLRKNRIELIKSYSFKGLSFLKFLYIGQNPIKLIESNAFAFLISLQSNFDLSLQYLSDLSSYFYSNVSNANKINQLTLKSSLISTLKNFTFYGLESLTFLDISENELKSIEIYAFRNLINLRTIHLKNNLLIAIDLGIFNNNLGDVNFEGNRLTSLSGTTFNSSRVREVILVDNRLEDIEKNLFKTMRNTLNINLELNRLGNIKRNYFEELTSLRILNLKSNQISSIEKDSFRDLKALRYLHLTNNTIFHIHESLFLSLTSLLQLELDRNVIKNLKDGTFNSTIRLTDLTASHNQITYLDSNIFSKLGFLTKLNLSNNLIRNLSSDAFNGLSSLTHLDLSSNRIGQFNISINCGRNLKKLNTLYVANNRLESLNPDELNACTQIRVLDLQNNNNIKLETKSQIYFDIIRDLILKNTSYDMVAQIDFSRMMRLTILDLKYNDLGNELVSKIFSNVFSDLTTLNAAGNNLSSFKFQTSLDDLTSLDFSDNNKLDLRNFTTNNNYLINRLNLKNVSLANLDEYVNPSTFPSLTQMDLSFNLIREIKSHNFKLNKVLKNLNLSRNLIEYIEPASFKFTETLEVLDLSFNRLKTFTDDIFESRIQIQAFFLNDNSIEIIDFTELKLSFNLLQLQNNKLKSEKIPLGLSMYSAKLANSFTYDLNLVNCTISEIEQSSFIDLRPILNLYLGQNKIREIGNGSFSELSNLIHLNLYSNEIEKLSDNSFKKLHNLLNLNLSMNLISSINKYLFNDLIKLVFLDLSYNRIKFIEDFSFMNQNKLKDLYLNENLDLEKLSEKSLHGLSSIENFLISPHLISILINQYYIKKSLKVEVVRRLDGLYDYMKSIYLLYWPRQYIFSDWECRNILSFIRSNINLNLRNDMDFLKFSTNEICQEFFRKSHAFNND